MPPSRKRADVLLVERGLFESRARAQAAIEAGLVSADARQVLKASANIATDAVLQAEPAHPLHTVPAAGASPFMPAVAMTACCGPALPPPAATPSSRSTIARSSIRRCAAR